MGALYLFARIDAQRYNIKNDKQFLLDFLRAKKVLMVEGTGFNWIAPDHFRVVYLPSVEQIKNVAERMTDFLKDYRQ
jgi:alanine-synthesizing transaminase